MSIKPMDISQKYNLMMDLAAKSGDAEAVKKVFSDAGSDKKLAKELKALLHFKDGTDTSGSSKPDRLYARLTLVLDLSKRLDKGEKLGDAISTLSQVDKRTLAQKCHDGAKPTLPIELLHAETELLSTIPPPPSAPPMDIPPPPMGQPVRFQRAPKPEVNPEEIARERKGVLEDLAAVISAVKTHGPEGEHLSNAQAVLSRARPFVTQYGKLPENREVSEQLKALEKLLMPSEKVTERLDTHIESLKKHVTALAGKAVGEETIGAARKAVNDARDFMSGELRNFPDAQASLQDQIKLLQRAIGTVAPDDDLVSTVPKEPLKTLPSSFSTLSPKQQAKLVREGIDQFLNRQIVDDGDRSPSNEKAMKKSEGDAALFMKVLLNKGYPTKPGSESSLYWSQFGSMVRDNPDRAIRCDASAALVVAALKEMGYPGPITVIEQGPGNSTGHFWVVIGQTTPITFDQAKKGKGWDEGAIGIDLWGVAAQRNREPETAAESSVEQPPRVLWNMGADNEFRLHKI